MTSKESLELLGYDHIKVAVSDIAKFERDLKSLGFLKITDQKPPQHLQTPYSIWGTGEAFFVIYQKDHPLAKLHFDLHGDTVFDLSFLVNGSRARPSSIEGAGKMRHSIHENRSFQKVKAPRGILRFDHNTINVDRGELQGTVENYLSTFGFEKGQYFDIKGKETGLYSWVTRAPNKTVQIPFNEAADSKSQIQEFINIHRGPGVQHIALITTNIVETMTGIYHDKENSIKFLDVPDTYYEIMGKRVKIREALKELEKLRILVDQDAKGGYLLQIFTQNVFGGFFFELIQREGNIGFGEGNFQALFESIELDQKRRGVL